MDQVHNMHTPMQGDPEERPTSFSSLPPQPLLCALLPPPADFTDANIHDSSERKHSLSPVKPGKLSPIKTSGYPISPKKEPQAYASLPPSPIPGEQTPQRIPTPSSSQPLFSIWDYLREELLATDFDSHQELKWERVSNFLSIPMAVEKIISFGFVLCLDSLLYTFTILPVRFTLAVARLLRNTSNRDEHLSPSQKADILRTLLHLVSVSILIPFSDASKIYHFIRGQDTIKLYVIFNALEIADRLCTSFGQDITDCLFSRSTLQPLSRKEAFGTLIFRPLLFFILATAYTVSHTLVLIYQLTSLNVAINSYDHSLLTLLVSNQFVEIKGSVFKKFEKDNLFQITCADIVERFQLFLMLLAVAFRNLIEMSSSELEPGDTLHLPQSFGWSRRGNLVWRIFSPVMTVFVSEVLVDWLKHAFITKFNHIRPSVYERYTDVLCRDLSSGSVVSRKALHKHSYVDRSPLVARRLGFATVPVGVLCVIIGAQCLSLVHASHANSHENHPMTHFVRNFKWIVLGILFWICFVVVKIMLGVKLLSFANRRRETMGIREAEDVVNDFGRDPIGEGREEREYNKELKVLLNRKEDDATPVSEMGENITLDIKSSNVPDGHRRRPKLEELTRFTMVKRIW